MTSVLRRTIRGGLGFLTANVIKRACGFLFVMIAGRMLGAAGFGVLSLGLSVSGLVRRLSEFGIPDTLVRTLAGEGEEEAERIAGASMALGGSLALAGAGGLAVAAPWLAETVFSEPDLAAPLRILAAAILLWVPISLVRALLQARERVERIIGLDVAQQVTRVLAVTVVLLLVGGVEPAAAAVVGSLLVPLAVGIAHLASIDVSPSFSRVGEKIGDVVELAAPLLVVGFSYTLARYADRIMLGALGDMGQVGIYTVIATLAMATLLLHGSLVSGFKPIAADAHRQGDLRDARPPYLLVSKWAGAGSGVLMVVFAGFGPEILGLFGPEYSTGAAHGALLILTGLFFVATWIGPTGAVLQMSTGERIEVANTVVFVAVNVALNFLLIPRYGVVGAATATLGSGLLRNLLQVVELTVLYDFVPVDPRHLQLFAGIALASGLMYTVRDRLALAVLLAAATGLGVVAYLWFSMSETERGYLDQLRGRLLERDAGGSP